MAKIYRTNGDVEIVEPKNEQTSSWKSYKA